MAKLVKRSQQVLSLRETIEKVNQELLSLTEQLKDVSVKSQTGEIPVDRVRDQVIRIQTKYEDLKKQKEVLLEKYKNLQQNEKRKQQIGDNGLIEFYNLVLSYRLPRKDGSSPVFIKIYEVPQMYMTQSTKSARVRHWVVALSGVEPSNSENYFQSNKPAQKMQNVHMSSDETNYHSIAREVKEIIENYEKPLGLALESVSLHQQLPAFEGQELSSVKKEVEKVIAKAAEGASEREQEQETRVEPEMKQDNPEKDKRFPSPFKQPKAPDYRYPNFKKEQE
jgi:hypothetical protein